MLFTKQDIKKDSLSGNTYYRMKNYVSIPLDESDIYVITTVGDSLTKLADMYYKDVSLWKLISVANDNITRGSMFPIPGTQLRIPLNISNFISYFK